MQLHELLSTVENAAKTGRDNMRHAGSVVLCLRRSSDGTATSPRDGAFATAPSMPAPKAGYPLRAIGAGFMFTGEAPSRLQENRKETGRCESGIPNAGYHASRDEYREPGT